VAYKSKTVTSRLIAAEHYSVGGDAGSCSAELNHSDIARTI
jgi:hypothetical protein